MSAVALEDRRLRDLLGKLTLEEKALLLTGRNFWTTWPIERIGLRAIVVSDGPSGVRGELWDERSPSLNLPSATALSSSWDLTVAERYGEACAVEARRKGVDVVLGPTINLHRSPLGGRHFESFSEDPLLTSELAAAFVRGVQRNGVGATPKHYVANDSETDRFTVDVVVSERTLRELYLLAFEKSITEARAWVVMSAYNSVNGARATENVLLETPLNSEWGFDGVVVSDWGAVRSLDSARYAQDLTMPGPGGPWGQALIDAVRAGEVSEEDVDRKVLRILLLAARVGALDGFDHVPPPPPPTGAAEAFAREAAVEGSVLLRNTDLLPIDVSKTHKIAVIGHNAQDARTQGGGSATVVPEYVVSPLEGIRDAFPDADVTYSLGAIVQEGVAPLRLSSMRNPVTGAEGARVRFLDWQGNELYTEDRQASSLFYFGDDTAPLSTAARLEFTTLYTPEETDTVLLGFASVGRGRIYVNEVLILEETSLPIGDDLGAALLSPPSATAPVALQGGVSVSIRVEFEPSRLSGSMSITVGVQPVQTDPEELIAEAARAAAEADIAVVVVGTNAAVESEGYDRTSLALPGNQDALVDAVRRANANTVVIVNAGAPVEMPWREDVGAVLLTYFGGQEYGNAVADVLAGVAEPGGRLPTTWPARQSDVPVINVEPQDGVLRYEEDIHIGYRAWLKSDAVPAYPFGHGLSYTEWLTASPQVQPDPAGDGWTVTVTTTNAGHRAGKNVIQIYAEKPDSVVERPARWLVGFATLRADPGETRTTQVRVPARAVAHWNSGWSYESGDYTLRIGTSSTDLPFTTTVTL
ncbi:glycosyl hydrolase [Pseudoclavibacter endophyticus]|uniref:Glycosyl hydrolase n=1 Tax=Pseudoclavibacter endophyticus TaxID=1778590 RepID=A0A6H9WMN7_9MICO|nr:glycosyl hydrolase [Pseudoclavibacter endophyticus]